MIRGAQSLCAEANDWKRVSRPPGRSQDGVFQQRPRIDDATDDPPVGPTVLAKSVRGFFDVPIHGGTSAIVEGMGEHHRGREPLETVLFEWKRAKKWRREAERVNGRADVVDKPRE